MTQENLHGLTFVERELTIPGGLRLPVRTTVVDVAGGRVVLSPTTRLSVEEWRALGPVTDLVATNLSHADGMARAAEAFPEARLWGPKGVLRKLPGLTWTGILGDTLWPYEQELAARFIDGMPNVNEWVFVHRASRTLVASDLVFHLVDAEGLMARVTFGLFGTWRRFAVSRLFLLFLKDRAAMRASLRALLSEEFDHVAPGHGRLVTGDGKQRLVAALRERALID
jgi:hypothetical protein